jgi:hypothetical protein
MKISNFLTTIISILIVLTLGACSGKQSGTGSPVAPDFISDETPQTVQTVQNPHDLVAEYDAIIDPSAGTFTIEPAQRTGEYHFPLTNMYPNVLAITGYHFGPPFTATIKLTHPYPTSNIIGYDPRVIACLPANAGVRAEFPAHQVYMNNSVLLEPDGYTRLHDVTTIPGNANPFKAYFKSKSYRQWGASTGTVESQTWVMDITGFGGPIKFKLIVDVSTNYPAVSTPVTDNCQEPYDLEIDTHGSMTSSGGTGYVDVFVYDWQGKDGIGSVKAEVPDLFDGMADLSYVADGPYPNSYLYSGSISNTKHTPAGQYKMLVSSNDYATGIQYFEITNVTVAPSPVNLIDLTPDHLNFSPQDIEVYEDYAYIAAGPNGMHVFYVGDPYVPVWVSSLNPGCIVQSLAAADAYLYMVSSLSQLMIVNIDNPEAPAIVGTAKLTMPGEDILIDNGYAYITTSNNSLDVVDISPPSSAHRVKSIAMDDPQGMDIDLARNLLFVADASYGLQIVDISTPESAYIKNTAHFTNACNDVAYMGSFVYLTNTSNKNIFKYLVADPTNPLLYDMSDTPGYPSSIISNNGIAYVTEANAPFDPGALYAIDESLSILDTVNTPGNAENASFYANFVFVVDSLGGFYSVNAYDSQALEIVAQIDTLGYARKVHATADYAYVADGAAGLRVLDINPAGEASIVRTVDTPGYANDVCVLGNYAYVADGGEGLQIIDINPPTSAHIVHNVNTSGISYGIYALAGRAYLADGSAGVQILDVSTPESAYILKTVDTAGQATDVTLGGYGRLYVADFTNGLVVININNISTAYVSNTVPMSPIAYAVTYMTGYVYVANSTSGLQIVNASTPDSEYIALTVDTPGIAEDVFIWDGFAYVADSFSGLSFVDISVPASATYLDSYLTGGPSQGVFVRGSMVYVADGWGGLKILQSM